MKKCLPLCLADPKELKALMSRYESKFDAFELWLDYLEPLTLKEVKEIVQKTSREVLLLFRRKLLEPSMTPFATRKKFIDKFQSERCIWDFDINVQEDELSYFRDTDRLSPLICSYHNYTRTPSDEELKALSARMDTYAPQIMKFACFAESNRDALRLMKFLIALNEEGKRAVVLGMGEKGIITRVFGGQYGNVYMFLTIEAEADVLKTAPGQLSIEKFEAITNILESAIQVRQ